MNIFNEGVLGGFGNGEAQFVVKGALIKVPIIFLEVREGDSFCI